MGWPQIAVIALMVLSAFIALDKHGKPRGTYSFPVTAIGIAFEAAILYAGGFWN